MVCRGELFAAGNESVVVDVLFAAENSLGVGGCHFSLRCMARGCVGDMIFEVLSFS